MSETGLMRHIEGLNRWEPGHFKGFYFAGGRYGYLKGAMLEALRQWPDTFRIDGEGVHLDPTLEGFEVRTRRLGEVSDSLVAQGIISHVHGERYALTSSGRESAIATIDRTAAAYFGARAYGQHLNGFVRLSGGLHLWIARRSADRRVYPGRLDNMVAGGLPYGLGLQANLLKECAEEASVPLGLALRARPVGALSYCKETPVGLKPDTLYCYDLELPPDFCPRNADGEVAEFMLLPVEEVLYLVRETGEFKSNCNLVLIDFFIRHGILTPESRDYIRLVQGLHERI